MQPFERQGDPIPDSDAIEMLRAGKENLMWLRCGCAIIILSGITCVAAAKVALDYLGNRAVVTTPQSPPVSTDSVRIMTLTPIPAHEPSETPTMVVERMVIKTGDTIWDLVQQLKQRYPRGGYYYFRPSATGVLSPVLSEDQVLELHDITPGDELIFFPITVW